MELAKEITGRLQVKNTILNLIGQIVPMLVGIIAIPILIKALGTEKFAIITIAWMLIGYFSLFDMGLGRALTQLVAVKLGNNETEEIPGIFWTSTTIITLFSILGAMLIAFFATTLVQRILQVPVALQSETITAMHVMAFSIPFVIVNAALVGFLTAYHRFDIINGIRIPMGLLTFLSPLIVLPFSTSLVAIVSSLIFFRILITFVQFWFCVRVVPVLRAKFVFDRNAVKLLLKFGSWMTISNVVGPVMMYFDRFLIGSIISLSAVAFYTTPYELVSKILIIPASLIGVLFPAFASVYARDKDKATHIFNQATKYLLLLMFPVMLLVVTFGHHLLALWLGEAFAANSYRVLQWLAIGIFMNSLAQVPFAFLQGIGRPDITSKLHLLELILYLPLLWYLVTFHGIEGAAISWCIRVAIDTLLLFLIARRFYNPHLTYSRTLKVFYIFSVPILVIAMVIPFHFLLYVLMPGIPLFCIVSWKQILSSEERTYVFHAIRLRC